MPDYETMMWAEVEDISKLLHDLDEPQWDAPTLCDGWLVRDVIGHMCYGHTTAMSRVMRDMVSYRFKVEKGSFELSKAFASARTPAELLDVWDRELVEGHTRRGIARFIPMNGAFMDHLIHNQDMRRPLGRPRQLPEVHLRAALDLVPKLNTPFFGTKKPIRGLALRATDIDWSWGSGPEVSGPGEAIVLAAGGRKAAFADLTGEGVATLADRVGASG